MYLSFFGFSRKPFSIPPDPDFMYWGPQHLQLHEQIRAEVTKGSKVTLLIGEAGSGKTHTVRKFLQDSKNTENLRVLSLESASGSETDVLKRVLLACPRGSYDDASTDWWASIQSVFKEFEARGERVLLVIDEAQSLSSSGAKALAKIVLEQDGTFPQIQMLLVGVPELHQLLSTSGFEVLRKNVGHELSLAALGKTEIGEYIEHRLKTAGATKTGLFDADAIEAIYGFTKGNPGLTNKLCEMCLFVGALEERKVIDAEFVGEVFADIGDRKETKPGLLTAMEGKAEPGKPLGLHASRPPVPVPSVPATVSTDEKTASGGSRTPVLMAAGIAGLVLAGGALWTTGMLQLPKTSEIVEATSRGEVSQITDTVGQIPAKDANTQASPQSSLALTSVQIADDLGGIEDEARMKLAALQEERLAAQEDIRLAKAELAKLQDALNAGQAQILDLDDQRSKTTASLDELQKELARLSQDEVAKEQALAALESEVSDTEEDLSKLRQEHALVRNAVTEAQRDRLEALPLLSAAPVGRTDASDFFAQAIAAETPKATSVAYARSALSGHEKAAIYLGQLFETGDGVDFLPEIAQRWYALGNGEAGLHDASLKKFGTDGSETYVNPLFSIKADGIVDLIWEGWARVFTIEVADADKEAIGRFETPLTAARLILPEDAMYWRVRTDADVAGAVEWQQIGKSAH